MNKMQERLSKYILADGLDLVMDLEKSKGSWIADKLNGKKYLDMFSMYASMAVGYNHPYIVERREWLGELAINKPTLSDVYNEHYAEFLEIFGRMAMPAYMEKSFFISGGSLAVENALKAAFDWKVKMNLKRKVKDKGFRILHFEEAFHGRSGYTLSLTNTADPRKTNYFPKFRWPRVKNPKLRFPLTESSLKETFKEERLAVTQIKDALKEFKDDIAAIIIEPIQGEGGDNHFREEFLRSLRKICDENEMLLIFDEVQTGIGLTGKMWAHEHAGVKPDLMAFGKKTQVCGMMGGGRLNLIEDNVFRQSSRINSTFGGNFIDMMRFRLILEIIEKENLLAMAKENGAYLLKKLRGIEEDFEAVTNTRGLGLMAAFDMPDPDSRNKLRKQLFEDGMIILACGQRSIRFRPHLNVTREEIDLAIDKIRGSLKK